jgi:hypothetical protein
MSSSGEYEYFVDQGFGNEAATTQSDWNNLGPNGFERKREVEPLGSSHHLVVGNTQGRQFLPPNPHPCRFSAPLYDADILSAYKASLVVVSAHMRASGCTPL